MRAVNGLRVLLVSAILCGMVQAAAGQTSANFYRKDPSLPSEQRYYSGTPPEVMRFGSARPSANF